MAVSKLKKIAVYGTGECQEAFLSEVQKTGILHIIPGSTQEDYRKQKDEITSLVHKTELVVDLLAKKAALSTFQKLKPAYIEEEELFARQASRFEADSAFVEEIWSKLQDRDNLISEIHELENILKELLPWKSVNVPVAELKSNQYTLTLLGKMPLRFYEEAKDRVFIPVEVTLLHQDQEYAYLAIIVFRSEKEAFLESVKNFGFEEYFPAPECKNISEGYARLVAELSKKRERLELVKKQIDTYVSELSRLQLFSDYLDNFKTKKDAEREVAHSTYTFSLSAWIAENHLPELKRLTDSLGYVDFEEVEPAKGEVAPINLVNGPLVEPFEFVTNMYSLPGDKEPDPTPFLAPFFALFLAFCLTDGGYGLMLTLTSWFALKKFRLGESMRKLFKILVMSGLMTVVLGLLTGGIFGIDVSLLAPDHWLAKTVTVVKVFDPSKDMMLFIAIALGLGYVHVLIGFVIGFIFKLGRKAVGEAFMDGLPWILIMVGGGLAIAGMVAAPSLKTPGIYTSLAGGLIILLFSGRNNADGIVGKLIWGIYGLYNVTGIFGDILSYARLFALGLSTGIIGGVMNKLSFSLVQSLSFDGLLPIVGSLLSIVGFLAILVFGHIFNLVISALGAFIHTMRLQFVEFFTKFFEGGGEMFIPFKVRLKYFIIKNKNK